MQEAESLRQARRHLPQMDRMDIPHCQERQERRADHPDAVHGERRMRIVYTKESVFIEEPIRKLTKHTYAPWRPTYLEMLITIIQMLYREGYELRLKEREQCRGLIREE